MNVVFLGEGYHFNNTKSSQFFIDILEKAYGKITLASKSALEVSKLKPDVVVLWQQLIPPEQIDYWQARNIILCPMYDACPHNLNYWNNYKKYKIFCFSKTLFNMLKQNGFNCFYSQYYVEPNIKTKTLSKNLNAFFWERTKNLTWNLVGKICNTLPISHLHFHTGLSQNTEKTSRPTEEENNKYSICYTDWFKDKNQMNSILDNTDVYFAPRRSEGIGLSFIEALARGNIVVAYDDVTMNEYITNGVDGILYTENSIPQKKFTQEELIAIKTKSIKRAENGYKEWNASIPNIIDFIKSPLIDYNPKKTIKARFSYFWFSTKEIIKKIIFWEKLRPLICK